MMGVYIIAEAGVNHNGNYETACRLADAAKQSGADCIKFQTFKSELVVSKSAPKAEYQNKTTSEESQLSMLKRLELTYDEFISLKKYCDDIGICFLSTAFDLDSIGFLDSIDIPFWKIPSGEVTNYPYLVKIAKTGKPVIMSTGMCDLDEIRDAIDVLVKNGVGNIRLMHCNTEYPTPYVDVNLKAMETMRREFDVEVGYSDHTEGIEVSLAAVALGATVIEKHFTLDRNMEGPDHRASIEPNELSELVRDIRHIEMAFGIAEKKPTPSERKNIKAARKSIVAKRKILAGELFTEENVTAKRPGVGISPMKWNEVIGTRAVRTFEEDEMIEI